MNTLVVKLYVKLRDFVIAENFHIFFYFQLVSFPINLINALAQRSPSP